MTRVLLHTAPPGVRQWLWQDAKIGALFTAGHMYEKDAIVQHFSNKMTDPMTGALCKSSAVTPVHSVKSRCLEYREKAGKACVERACSVSCKDPMKYIRRAVELCANVNLRVPGLTPDFILYISSHGSNAYDAMALNCFAEGLKASGYIDRAANLYYR